MSTSYRPLITNLDRSIHDDVSGARTRLREAIKLLEQAPSTVADAEKLTAVVADLRAVERRLVELADR
ncbi:hypothetical protein [Mycobacterium avium]|uniref:Uncharacterized protein n=1 Tax=Mycobacterium avium (strain 104) TaxID=243243 RepID=A0A0H2ZU82_MYCA1|nr:hypothetical protein [Mycobacterium avium]ABK65232.1 hypothetical protein MAV_0281 [Mycobacterium avium 104]KDP09306.1 hypothetical protein MAV101_01415 [Mycobacterium avium subsp. hominissuis 101]MBZ4511041.1 hypothetical protein [Mycobacterium avium subsp. hominissuis]MCG3243006.1 hypothetical protein [Mycobacterium avium subsp. hominissuis]